MDASREPGLEGGEELSLTASDGWPDLVGIHVALIEDNSDTRTMVEEVLRHCGAMVTTYESADAAIEQLSEFVPSLIISDLSMPGVDGLEFMRRVRALPPERGGCIPALAITAYHEDFAAPAAVQAGFNAYLTKPLKLERLCAAVKELVARPA
jgi:CheY-like chemotaxis protein